MKKFITVFGPSSALPDSALYAEAESLGGMLGAKGFNVVTGGYEGVMEAASKGARANEAGTVGVTAEVYYARGRAANAYITKELRVKSAVDRLMELIDLADAFVAIGNSPGTLLEVMTVWEYILKAFIEPKPIILVGEDWQALEQLFDMQNTFASHKKYLTFVNDAKAAVAVLGQIFGEQQKLPELHILS
ncbi:MAG: LOG family protein [Candidatus Kapaibacterium sp.]|jgi:uncharacterized protein (TIGR00730 family)